MNKTVWFVLGGLATVYAVNVAANAFYKAVTRERIELLTERSDSLARIDPKTRDIGKIRQLITDAGYGSFTTAAPLAIAKGGTLATYLNQHPHLLLGVAVDGDDLNRHQVAGVLRELNKRLKPHRISVGLSEPIVKINIPIQATRDDVFHGVTTAFKRRPDYHIAFTTRTCSYALGKAAPDEPGSNRLYTFGLKGLTIIDGTAIDSRLTERLLADLANFIVGDRRERRWRTKDYAQRSDSILEGRKLLGRVVRRIGKRNLTKQENRMVKVMLGLDSVTKADARAYFDQVNVAFEAYGIRFTLHHLYEHRLDAKWKWPIEIKRMQDQGESDVFVLLTSAEWTLPQSRHHLRGLGSAFFGAVMVQTGTRAETNKRLAHELGHLFNLPHTFLRGHIMYPNERGIGLSWSPGANRLLNENKLNTTWHSVQTYRERFEIGVKLAPFLTRSSIGRGAALPQTNFASEDAWVTCRK